MSDLFATALFAQDGEASGGGGIASLAILLLIPLAMYFFMIRPQRKRMREQSQMQSSLGVGDEVITSSGIYGFITGEEGDRFWLEIDDDVQVRIAREAIRSKVDTAAEAKAADATDDGDEADGDDES